MGSGAKENAGATAGDSTGEYQPQIHGFCLKKVQSDTRIKGKPIKRRALNKIKPRLSWSMFHKSVQEEETEGLLVSPCSFRLGFPIILRFGMHLLNFSLVPLPKKPHLLRQCVQRTKGANYDILIRRTEGEDTEDYALWPHQKKRKRKKFRTLNIGSFFFLSFFFFFIS